MENKTKRIAPWKLRVGMKIAPLRNSWESVGSPYAYAPMGRITEIAKGRATFTGATVWRVRTDLGEQLSYQGKRHSMQAEYATILVNP